MKKAMALLCALKVLLGIVLGFAVSVPAQTLGMFSSTSPNGRPQISGTPARLPLPLGVGVQGYNVANVSEYGTIGANTSFNIQNIRMGAVAEYSALDSIYDRLRTQWELAYNMNVFGAGVAYNLDMERVAEHVKETWATHKILFGAYARFPERILYSGLVRIATEKSNSNSYVASLYWILNSYTLYIEYEWDREHSMQFGQELFFGAWGVECAYKYPGSRLYLGIAVWFKNVNVFAGASSVSRDYLGRTWRLEFER